jgi:hypothetical protein
MKTKNPLYVVKGKTVLEASGVFDLISKKFNLGPSIAIFMKIMEFIFIQVKDYPSFVMIKKFFDELVEKASALLGRAAARS